MQAVSKNLKQDNERHTLFELLFMKLNNRSLVFFNIFTASDACRHFEFT